MTIICISPLMNLSMMMIIHELVVPTRQLLGFFTHSSHNTWDTRGAMQASTTRSMRYEEFNFLESAGSLTHPSSPQRGSDITRRQHCVKGTQHRAHTSRNNNSRLPGSADAKPSKASTTISATIAVFLLIMIDYGLRRGGRRVRRSVSRIRCQHRVAGMSESDGGGRGTGVVLVIVKSRWAYARGWWFEYSATLALRAS